MEKEELDAIATAVVERLDERDKAHNEAHRRLNTFLEIFDSASSTIGKWLLLIILAGLIFIFGMGIKSRLGGP